MLYFLGSSDISLITPTTTFPPHTFGTQPVMFTLVLDSVAQEINETFTLRLNYDKSLFGPHDDLTQDELKVTIIDANGTIIIMLARRTEFLLD